ncbi:MAG: hypothetical protein KTR24_15075 [Saprospiraceae bacterium]|nr:hypothetical protein [Saprospiraceae bacterium]
MYIQAIAPNSLIILFIATTALTVFLAHRAFAVRLQNQGRIYFLTLIALLLLTQAIAASRGFYLSKLEAMPPRFLLAIVPIFSCFIFLLANAKTRSWLLKSSLKQLTWLSIVRIPVEFVLYGLSLADLIPELMTFAGRNYDILAGLSAPIIVLIGFRGGVVQRRSLLIIWNIASLILLLLIISQAFLSAPFPTQQMGFDQPNIGILQFPFIWLPVFVAPMVLFTHIISLMILSRGNRPV